MTPLLIRQLSAWQWRLLALLIYAIPSMRGLKNVLWFALVALWLLRCALQHTGPKPGRIEGAALFWLAAGAWSTCFAIQMDQSLRGWWDMVRSTVLIFIVSDCLLNDSMRKSLFRHVALGTALSAGAGILQYGWRLSRPEAYAPLIHLQLHGVGHFNQSAIYLAMAWLVALVCVLDDHIFYRRRLSVSFFSKRPHTNGALDFLIFIRRMMRHYWVGRLSVILIGLALLATTSRSAVAVATVACALILLKIRPSKWLILALIGALLLVAISLTFSSTLRERAFFHGSWSNRVLFWQSAVDTMRTRPWTGIGLNNFGNINLRTRDPFSLGTIDHAHNLYFNTLAQLGIPGTIALLALLAASGSLIWKYRPAGAASGLWFCGVGGVWLVIVLEGLSNTTLHQEMSMLFFIILGVIARMDRPPAKLTAVKGR